MNPKPFKITTKKCASRNGVQSSCCGAAIRRTEVLKWVINCLGSSPEARLLYPGKLPRRPFGIEAVTACSTAGKRRNSIPRWSAKREAHEGNC